MRWLDGALDLHVHSGPDHVARCVDDITLAEACAAAGCVATVIKSHHEGTAARAELAMRHARPPAPVQMFGSVTLNHSVGGLNPWAVHAMARVEGGRGRIVWLPTLDATNDRRQKGKAGLSTDDAGITAAEDDRLHPALAGVFSAVRQHDFVLATGHLSPVEGLAVIAAARAAGIERIVATHVSSDITRYSAEQMARAADLGATLEVCALNAFQAGAREGQAGRMSDSWLQEMADVMARVGYDAFMLSSDFGRADLPSPPVGLEAFAEGLHRAGVPRDTLRAMLVDTPARLVRYAPHDGPSHR